MSQVNRFEPYQCNHLFLLIGTNPLPNYVAGRLLLRPGAYVHLLASDKVGDSGGTVGVAGKLKEKLNDLPIAPAGCRIIGLDDVSDALKIERQVRQYIEGLGISRAGSRIGLHYTGGTKPMSVHTHETLKEWCNKQGLAYQFSYLDPRHLSFRFANGVEVPILPNDCSLTLESLVGLHNWEITSEKPTPLLSDFSRKLMVNIVTESTPEEWRRWCDWYLRTWSGRNKWISDGHLPNFKDSQLAPELLRWIELSSSNELTIESLIQWVSTTDLKKKKSELSWVPIHPAVPTETKATNLAELRAELAPYTGWPDNNQGFKPLAQFLDGEWLEDYVLDCIQNITTQCDLERRQTRASLEVERKEKSVKFEFDVAVLKGYRLFALSCSTSTNRHLLKHKLFEAYTRARQMGGDEARVALVGGIAETESLLWEVNEEWLVPQDVIHIFGSQDWPDLETKLAEWFNWRPG